MSNLSEAMKIRLKSKATWVSIAALIPVILQIFGMDILPKDYATSVNAVLVLLVSMGVINNPTTEGNWYLDDKNQANSDTSDKVQ